MSGGQGDWVLRGHERHGDALVSEQPLTGVDTDVLARFLREHLDIPEDEPLIFDYPLTPDMADSLREEVGVEAHLDFSREEYFVDFDA
jgi:hypothetical protein